MISPDEFVLKNACWTPKWGGEMWSTPGTPKPYWLVVWNIFFHILRIIIPTDELIFFRGVDQPPTSIPAIALHGLGGKHGAAKDSCSCSAKFRAVCLCEFCLCVVMCACEEEDLEPEAG